MKAAAIEAYDKTMESELDGKIPCDNDVIRRAHLNSLDVALKIFKKETFGISVANAQHCLKEMKVIEQKIRHKQNENKILISIEGEFSLQPLRRLQLFYLIKLSIYLSK